jgi:hypothetical protein
MGYIEDFLKKDEEDAPWWERGDTSDSPAAISGDPNPDFEENISNGLASSPAPGGNLDAYTPADDQAFHSFIDGAADPSATVDSSDPFTDDEKKSIGRRFDQEAFSDMRQQAMRHDAGFNGDDAALGGIAAALDLMFNKGRDLGGIASGIGQGVVARQAQNNKRIGELADASIGMAKQDRAVANDASRNAYYQHERDMEDKRFAEGAPLRAANTESAQSDATMKALDALFAQEHGGFTPSEYSANQRADAAVTHQKEREAVSDAEHQADNARADEQLHAPEKRAAAKSAADEAKIQAAMDSLPDWLDRTDPEAVKVAMADPITRRKLIAAIQGGDSSLDAMQGMMEERGKGPMLPFVDEKRAGDYDLKRRGVFGGLSPFTQLGTLQKSDIDMLEPTIPDSLNLKDVAGFWGEDPNSNVLEGGDKALRDMVSRGVGTYGLTPNYDKWAAARAARNPLGVGNQTPAPATQPNAVAGRPGKDPALTLPDNTTAPGPAQNMPAIRLGGGKPGGGTAGLIGTDNGDGTVTVRFPDGSSGHYSIDDPRLKKKGVLIQ